MDNKDAINPNHYKELNPEPIDVIEAWDFDYYLGTVIKYLSRAGRKTPDPLEDLKKARWYLDRKIQRLEKEAKSLEQIKKYKIYQKQQFDVQQAIFRQYQEKGIVSDSEGCDKDR